MSRQQADRLALQGDGLPSFSWLEKLLAALAGGIAIAGVIGEARGFDRPTRDGVDDLPVWGIQRCPRNYADDRGCRSWKAVDLATRRACDAYLKAAGPRLPGDRLICQPEPDAVSRALGFLQVRP